MFMLVGLQLLKNASQRRSTLLQLKSVTMGACNYLRIKGMLLRR